MIIDAWCIHPRPNYEMTREMTKVMVSTAFYTKDKVISKQENIPTRSIHIAYVASFNDNCTFVILLSNSIDHIMNIHTSLIGAY